jgi:mRNA-degrading endonuclease RelE of RelBE toxin-antitoxin system
MSKVFIETTVFTKVRNRFLSEEDYEELQKDLSERPDCGNVMPGCGGLRKLRIADPKRGKGKRSGARLIYLYLPQIEHFLMLDIYGKNEKEDLSANDKKDLRQLAQLFKEQMIQKISRGKM